jgi:hypothetical protein
MLVGWERSSPTVAPNSNRTDLVVLQQSTNRMTTKDHSNQSTAAATAHPSSPAMDHEQTLCLMPDLGP